MNPVTKLFALFSALALPCSAYLAAIPLRYGNKIKLAPFQYFFYFCPFILNTADYGEQTDTFGRR
jgi:hypothetical protein